VISAPKNCESFVARATIGLTDPRLLAGNTEYQVDGLHHSGGVCATTCVRIISGRPRVVSRGAWRGGRDDAAGGGWGCADLGMCLYLQESAFPGRACGNATTAQSMRQFDSALTRSGRLRSFNFILALC
jgi:hypothetical protein